jgi:hypothetical protein
VAIDKFTKWIEVKPVTCPKADRVLNFLDELVHRYELPHRIITDLGSNFNNHQFWEYYKNCGINVRYVSIAHRRANGQVECNTLILLKFWLYKNLLETLYCLRNIRLFHLFFRHSKTFLK